MIYKISNTKRFTGLNTYYIVSADGLTFYVVGDIFHNCLFTPEEFRNQFSTLAAVGRNLDFVAFARAWMKLFPDAPIPAIMRGEGYDTLYLPPSPGWEGWVMSDWQYLGSVFDDNLRIT